MIHEDRFMALKHLVAALGVALAIGCTSPNPRSCVDNGFCNDPSLPFCDVDGAISGVPETCIAVDCMPGEFVACRGDAAIACNATGSNYEVTSCQLGCEAMTGCRLCEPSQTACTNGTVATCDANGVVVSSEKCGLGCFEDQPRCREIQPSNNLGDYLVMVQDPPDVTLQNAQFFTDTGMVIEGTSEIQIPNFLVPPSGNGAAIRVYVVNSLKLTSATISSSGDEHLRAGPAIAFVSRGDVVLEGDIQIAPRSGGAMNGCRPAGICNFYEHSSGTMVAASGGGGGNATEGGDGGTVTNTGQNQDTPGGVKDFASGTIGLVPLRGGCSGGFVNPDSTTPYPNGGGAIQISSRTKIVILERLDARGRVGILEQLQQSNGGFVGGGGGAGGSLLLEAPEVTLGPNAQLLAGGGDGATCAPSPRCSPAGLGARPGQPATAGGNLGIMSPNVTTGGGGGGLGRIRINTADGNYNKVSSTIEEGEISTSAVVTR